MELGSETKIVAGSDFFACMALFIDRHDLLKHVSPLKIDHTFSTIPAPDGGSKMPWRPMEWMKTWNINLANFFSQDANFDIFTNKSDIFVMN
jgi:hypothetical protein